MNNIARIMCFGCIKIVIWLDFYVVLSYKFLKTMGRGVVYGSRTDYA